MLVGAVLPDPEVLLEQVLLESQVTVLEDVVALLELLAEIEPDPQQSFAANQKVGVEFWQPSLLASRQQGKQVLLDC